MLARDTAAHAELDDPMTVSWLLGELSKANAHDQVHALLARDPSTSTLDDPREVAWLLHRLQGAGAHEQVQDLLARGNPTFSLQKSSRAGVDRPLLLSLGAAYSAGVSGVVAMVCRVPSYQA